MCLVGPVFSTGPAVGLADVHLGLSLSDRRLGLVGSDLEMTQS